MPRSAFTASFALSFCLLLSCLIVSPIMARTPSAIEVPVQYNLGVPNTPPITGFITGGGICEPEGLVLVPVNATEPVLFPYESIDKATEISLKGDDEVSLKLRMRGGKEIVATAKITDAEPILVLRDEVTAGAEPSTAKIRTFQKAGFRGIPLIEFEAMPEIEVDLVAIKKMNADFIKALESGDFDKAIDRYNEMGEALEKSQNVGNHQ